MPRDAIIVNFDLGNLFSVQQALRLVGLPARISADPADIADAPLVILPGVGAFMSAMRVLHQRGMVRALKQHAESGRPLVGICLGMQLLMDSSDEMGHCAGLGLIPGTVRKLPAGQQDERGQRLKIPTIGWQPVRRAANADWLDTPLADTAQDELFYFVHSYQVVPDQPSHWLAESDYGRHRYCAAIRHHNLIGMQFHPERSGPAGLRIYRQLALLLGAG